MKVSTVVAAQGLLLPLRCATADGSKEESFQLSLRPAFAAFCSLRSRHAKR